MRRSITSFAKRYQCPAHYEVGKIKESDISNNCNDEDVQKGKKNGFSHLLILRLTIGTTSKLTQKLKQQRVIDNAHTDALISTGEFRRVSCSNHNKRQSRSYVRISKGKNARRSYQSGSSRFP